MIYVSWDDLPSGMLSSSFWTMTEILEIGDDGRSVSGRTDVESIGFWSIDASVAHFPAIF